MSRKYLTLIIFCFLVIPFLSLAQQPEKKVMTYIAVLDLNCGEGVKKGLSGPLTNVIIQELVKIGKYTVIDRANRDKILSEQGFQQTGCAADQCVVEMGRLLGVGKIVVGSIDLIGQTYLVNLQLVNVETGAVEVAEKETCKCEEEGLIQTVSAVARRLMGMKAAVADCYYYRVGVFPNLKIFLWLRKSGLPAGFTFDDGTRNSINSIVELSPKKDAPAGSYLIVVGPYKTGAEVRKAVESAMVMWGFQWVESEVFKPDDCESFETSLQRKPPGIGY